MDIKKQVYSYIYGILLTDGNLSLYTRNRGKVTLEISEKDRDILYQINKLVPGGIRHRQRVTNFSNGKIFVSFTWENHKKEFREELMSYGFPYENKSENALPPSSEYNEKGFWRGVIDGDGSLGYTANGFPFLSFVTKSEQLKTAYLKFLLTHFEIAKLPNRNTRDFIYNICVYKENAQRVSDFLYKNSGIFIPRKYNKYLEVKRWVRPLTMKKKGFDWRTK